MNEIKYIKIPTICPYCNSNLKIIQNNDVKTLNCINDNCPEKLLNKLNHFCSKDKGLDIRGLSKATLEKLIDWNWVENISDLYELKLMRAEWIKQPGFGEKSVDNILTAVENSKNCELSSFISAIGIPLIGSTYAKMLCKKEIDWHNIREDIDGGYDFTQWDGFGYEMDRALKSFDYKEADYLANYILNIKNSLWEDPNKANELPLKGMIICITGKLDKFKNRDTAIKEIEILGGKVTSSVSKNTTILINNDINSTSSKNLTAQKLGIPVVTEQEFFDKYLTI